MHKRGHNLLVWLLAILFCAAALPALAEETAWAEGGAIATRETAWAEDAAPAEEIVLEEGDASAVAYDQGGYLLTELAGTPATMDSRSNLAEAEALLAAGIRDRMAEIDIKSCHVQATELNALMGRVRNYNPSLFYLESRYQYTWVRPTGVVEKVYPLYDPAYGPAESAIYEGAVQRALAQVDDKMTAWQKLMTLHNYLAQNVEYDMQLQNFNAYNALVEGRAVCQGYALAYADLLMRLGIDVDYAESEAMNHIWNVVRVDGAWYHIDNTWDDPVPDRQGQVLYENFLRSDAGIQAAQHHDWVSPYACTSAKYDSGQFWHDLDTMVYFDAPDTAWYLEASGTGSGMKASLIKRSLRSGTTQTLLSVGNCWLVWDDPTKCYTKGFTTLSRDGGVFYLGCRDAIYSVHGKSLTAEYNVSPQKEGGYLYGLTVRNGQAVMDLAKDPNGGFTEKIVTLRAVEPEPVPLANGWYVDNGKAYWYENGVKQGTTGRGKEIYDPASDAWYWLDAVQGGAKAVSKDVYQESSGGKWVRYDANGHMVKGWQTTKDGTYYFDPVTGAMQKGQLTIGNQSCWFDETTGIGLNGWKRINGGDYWYEGGVRQGYRPGADGKPDLSYRGKEIYDPGTDAWYWLDNVDCGKKAVSKDVYQESEAGPWADRPDGTGKWVRYDANGHMVKGWQNTPSGQYYFDPVYGTMAKGRAVINGVAYRFDVNTGVRL